MKQNARVAVVFALSSSGCMAGWINDELPKQAPPTRPAHMKMP